jgi:hypothetical protein
VLREAHRRGYAHAQVLRSFAVDTVDNRAEAALDVVLGPVVTVDSIIVRGAPNMGRAAVLRQIEVGRATCCGRRHWWKASATCTSWRSSRWRR